MKKRIKKIQTAIVAALLLVVTVAVVVNCQHTANYRVLIIHSFDQNFPNYPEFNRLIDSEFRKQGEPVTISTYYLDSEARNHGQELDYIKQVLDNIKPEEEPDLIIPVGDQATYSLLVQQHPLTKRIPVVFIGVQFPNKGMLSKYTTVTGVTDTIDVLENMKIIREIIGHRHTFTILENRVLDKMTVKLCKEQLDTLPNVINNLEWKHTLYHVRTTPDSIFTLTSLSTRDGERNTASQSDKATLGDENFFFLMRSDQPFYYLQLKSEGFSNAALNFTNKEKFTAVYNYFATDRGSFVGGYFSPMKYQAADGVALAIRVLRGEDPGNIPFHNSRKARFLDWPNYRHLGVPIDSIPEGYELTRAYFSDYHPRLAYWIRILGFSILGGVIVTLLVLFIRERMHRLHTIKQSLEEREMLKTALQNSQAFAWKQRGEEITLEEEFWNYLGQSPHLIQMKDFAKYIHPDTRSTYENEVNKLEKGLTSIIEVQCDFLRTGSYEWWQIRANHAQKQSNYNSGSYGLLINIDNIKEREQELIEARKMAEKAELKESFLANMSHEIRTPLNAIVGFSNILATPGMEFEDEEKEEMMETINKNNDLLLKLIDDVLDLSRIESGHITLQPVPCDLDKMMNYIHQSYTVQAPSHITYELMQGEHNLTIIGDEKRIEQVMINFLSNAAKFTPKGSVYLGWKNSEQTQEVELYVEDTGIGMSREQQLMVFERFYKVDEFRQGTGLGLSICKVIADKLGARITLVSEPGKGSRFSLWVKRV